jgi:nucleoside-diphosphate-sugar epimerase
LRVVVTGASGNVGTSVVARLGDDPAVSSILGLARRRPAWHPPKTTWATADVARDDLVPLLRGADVVIHLAWLIQPSHRMAEVEAVNVRGSERVFEAAARADVGALVHASSVGAYSPGPKEPVDESWPTDGIETSYYSRHKAAVERTLDRVEAAQPDLRVVRLRPGLIFKRDAASEIRRLFLGPLFPNRLVRPGLVPLLPRIRGLRFPAVHSLDVAEAYRLAATRPVRGAFNIAADPALDLPAVAERLHARTVPVPARAVRALAGASWRARLQPASPGWLDLALQTPLLDSGRARRELGWRPERSSTEALDALLDGLRDGAGFPTPPLEEAAGGRFRQRELPAGARSSVPGGGRG